DLIGWNKATLPEVREPTDRAGSVSAGAASKFGLKQGTPVFVGTCDTAAETWGAGAISTGDAVIKLATAGVVSVMVDRPFLQPEIAYKSYVVPGSGYVLGAINSCASAHKWLRNLLVGADSGSKGFAMLDQEAASAPAGADGVLFHPYLQGERAPYWDPKLRADFLGMTMSHGRGHLTRAFYEGVAFALRDASSPFMAAGLKIGQASLIGGGAKSDLWAKIIADVFQIPISKPLHGDASFAAALLAGVGAGAFADTRDAVTQTMKLSLTIEPDNNNRDLYDQAFAGYKKSKILLTDLNHEISSRVNK
ncbi:xylulokinase, partial [Salmonella enterica subsp. enterica]|nr:xylulokinase [Salmonella enterica subsp. enterica]